MTDVEESTRNSTVKSRLGLKDRWEYVDNACNAITVSWIKKMNEGEKEKNVTTVDLGGFHYRRNSNTKTIASSISPE